MSFYYSVGDIAFRIIDEMKEASNGVLDEENFGHVTVCDINKSMLEVGQDRAKKVIITWQCIQFISWISLCTKSWFTNYFLLIFS